jgi:hypothetical protein
MARLIARVYRTKCMPKHARIIQLQRAIPHPSPHRADEECFNLWRDYSSSAADLATKTELINRVAPMICKSPTPLEWAIEPLARNCGHEECEQCEWFNTHGWAQ